MSTHIITTKGREIVVTKCGNSIGVDADGKVWPLRIKRGQRGYSIRAIRPSIESANDELRMHWYAY